MSDKNTTFETDEDSLDEFSTNVGSKKSLTINSSENSSSEESENDGNAEICSICLGKLKNAKNLGNPESCYHHFCFECILEWSKNVSTCPVDRVKFRWILLREEMNGEEIKRVEVKTQKTESNSEDYTLCEICHLGDREERLLLCDGCDKGYHLECLTPALFEVPRGEWFCPICAEDVLEVEEEPSRRSRSQVIAMTMASRRVLKRLRRESRGSRKKSSKHKKSKKKKLKLKTTKRKLLEYMGMKPVIRKGKVIVEQIKRKKNDDDTNEPSVFLDSHIDPYSISNELYDDMHHPSTSHQAPSASSSSSDLLSSILKSQAILFMDSDNVKIDENGSLQPLKPIPDITMHTFTSFSQANSNNHLNDKHLFNFMLNQNEKLKTSISPQTLTKDPMVSKLPSTSSSSSTSSWPNNNSTSSFNKNTSTSNSNTKNHEKYKNSKNCYKNSKNSPSLDSLHLDKAKRGCEDVADMNPPSESRHKKAKLKEDCDEKHDRKLRDDKKILINKYAQYNRSLKKNENELTVENHISIKPCTETNPKPNLPQKSLTGCQVIEIKPQKNFDDDEVDEDDEYVDNLLGDVYDELEDENYFNHISSTHQSKENDKNNKAREEKGTDDKKDFLRIKNDNVKNNLNLKDIEESKKQAKREKLKAADMLVSQALKPFYNAKQIDKQQYKQIMRKTVPKIVMSKEPLEEKRVVDFVRKYVKVFLTRTLF